MLTDDVIDEDLEALLYAQIHYGPQSDSIEGNIYLTDCEGSNVNFTLANLEDSAIHFTEETSNIVHSDENCSQNEAVINPLNDNFDRTTHLSPDNQQEIIEKELLVTSSPTPPDFETTTESLLKSTDTSPIKPTIATSSLPNPQTKFASSNITINQYIYPDSQFWDSLKTYRHIWSSRCSKDLKRVQKGKLDEKKFFKVLNSRLKQWNKNFKKQEQIRKAVFKKRRRIAASEIVCLSDSDNSDVEFISAVEPKKDSMKVANIVNIHDSNDDSNSNADDDEIIYVEPPPVPVVNVDDESHDEEEAIKETQLPEAEECSNDFLILTATSDTFNFSLHDSEFQETEFPRPALPCPTYETESSTTSTSEFNKDTSQVFNRSFKTIVFNEIDFPKEDIFDGNNLDKFGDLIAPTGVDNSEIGGATTEAAMGKIDFYIPATDRRASDSGTSSESDYEMPKSIEKNLPDLCPIKITPDKESLKKNSSKAASVDESFGGGSGISESSVTLGKGKGKSDGEMDESFGRKKLKKKKKLAGSKVDNPLTILEGISNAVDIISLNTSYSVLNESCKEPSEAAKKKNKKKKKAAEILEPNEIGKPTKRTKIIKTGAQDQSLNETELQEEEDVSKKKKKRKQKSIEAMEQTTPQQCEEIVGEPIVEESSIQRASRKKKKGVSEKPEQNVDVVENEKANVNEKVVDEDVILIEKVIPTHTIDSSESDNDDIITFEDVAAELELANICVPEMKELQNQKHSNCSVDWSNSIEFDVEELQNKMSDDPDKWKILPVDFYPLSVRKKGPRCNKCRQFGHIALACPNKPCIPSCTMCGFQGHMEPRCPNTLCLTCAKPGSYTTVACRKCVNHMNSATCYICKLAGHLGNACPDLWRRYSMTTTEGSIVRRKKKLIPRNKQWCSGCASQGHLEHECASNKWIRQYPASSPMIFNYSNVYAKSNTGVRGNVDLRRKLVDKRNNRQCDSVMQVNQEIVIPPGVDNAQSGIGNVSRSVILQEISAEHLPEVASHGALIPPPPLLQSTFNVVELRQEAVPDNSIGPNIVSPGCEPLMLNSRSRRRALRKPKINPFSVVNTQRKYSSYQPMLNPYSMLGFNNAGEQNMSFRLENKSARALNSLQSSGLFNSVPSEVLAQQVLNLTNSMAATYQRNDQNVFGAPELNFEPPPPSSIDFNHPHQSLSFVDETASQFEERYHDYIAYQRRTNFMDRPYTITREEPNDNSERQNFIDRDTSRSSRLDNVEEITSKKFIHDSMLNLKEFIRSELEKLGNIKNHEAKLYKKKLNSIDQLKKIEVKTNSVKKQIYFNYKHINMFLFGTQRLAEGKHHLDFLRNFVLHPGCKDLRDNKRRALLEAYGYIFGGEHPNFNYRKFLNHLTLGFRQRR
ncbi:uncharacterized protein [Euwallacea fornicatus]|uniref:uncharacterized protein n=1 Tax=Euwallacea fornicatus TaxID=995702 RepID=UPI00338F84FD